MEGEDPGETQRWMINGVKVRRQHKHEMLKRTQIILTPRVRKNKKDVCAYHAEREKVDGCDRCRDTALYITSYCFRSDSLKNSLKLLSILRQSVQCTDISPTYFCSLEMTRRSRLIQGVWPQRIRIWSCERGTCDEISALGYSSSLKVSMIYKICFNAFDRKTQSAWLQTHTHKAEIISFILPQICDNVADWDLHK